MTETAQPRATGTRWAIAIGYVLCWVLGLLIGGPSLPPEATAAEVTAEFTRSPAAVFTFAVLVHGVAAILLAGLGWSLAPRWMSRHMIAWACAAAALSLVQLAGETALVFRPVGPHAATLWEIIGRLDGLKMLVLAGLITVVHGGRSSRRTVLTVVSAVTVPALLISGIGYVVLLPALMSAATVSLPLLLLWALTATAALGQRPVAKDQDVSQVSTPPR